MTIGAKIVYLREQLNISQKELAAKLGISPSVVKNLTESSPPML